MAEVIWTIRAVDRVEQIGLFVEKDSPFQAIDRLVVRARGIGRGQLACGSDSGYTGMGKEPCL
jgi:hypothetical protein